MFSMINYRLPIGGKTFIQDIKDEYVRETEYPHESFIARQKQTPLLNKSYTPPFSNIICSTNVFICTC